MRFTVALLISAICLSIISGCNSNAEHNKDIIKVGDIQYQSTGNDPLILLHDLVEGGMDMEVIGTLTYNSNNKCLYLYNNKEDIIYTPIWPKGTTSYFENNLRGVQLPSHGTILEGEDISTAGGGINYTIFEDHDFHSDCLDNNNIVLITPAY